MSINSPYVIDIEASVTGRVLLFAESEEEAGILLRERYAELIDELAAKAGLPDNSVVLYDADIRPATPAEVLGDPYAGQPRLSAGLLTLDECACCTANAATTSPKES